MYEGKFKPGIYITEDMKGLMHEKPKVSKFFAMTPEVLQAEIVGDKNTPLPAALREIKVLAKLASHSSRPETLLQEFGQLDLPVVQAKE
ncbi:MAG: hypothetical protein LLF94_06265 [Chlamydiales bacterium]|nr:hypothetical protein [Chlamydiales bacterium]